MTMTLTSAFSHQTIPAQGLWVSKIRKVYGKRPVVREVSLCLRQGEVVGLLGPNGAGKTTTFSMIAGLVMPQAGKIILDGHPITALPMYQRARLGIGYLPQEASVFRGLTVSQNIMAVLELIEDDPDTREDRLASLLSEFSIDHLRDSSALTLSGGERRRLEIARALSANPRFIMLDEPLAGIDPIAVLDIRNLIAHLKDRHIGVLITDHNVREALEIVDRAYIIADGKILKEGTSQEIVQDENVRRIYLGKDFKL